MIHSDINTLESPLFCSSFNKPIISLSTYIRNRRKNLDCDYWKIHLFDGCIKFDPRFLHEVSNSYKSNTIPSSATLSKITDITNKYFADKRIYIPESLPQLYYYIAPRANGKTLRTLYCLASHTPTITYSSEYTTQDYKSEI